MSGDIEQIAEIVRLTARLSLVVFCIAFVAETQSKERALKRFLYAVFYAAHGVHLCVVAFYFYALGEPPEMTPVTALLWLGVAAWVCVAVAVYMPGEKGPTLMPPLIVWYLWFLFAATEASRLLDPARAETANWLLLGLALAAGTIRARRDLEPGAWRPGSDVR
ncbi:hypothetical protein [Hyphococcus luteus]|uniref:Uncharacterized protein n=1 Tax=Hyphococcus luteus TaxID=2058213 RepID=A0A2S7JZQ1_9PROT|nr:hypothetical protein [Marinicaulis flavus]PQA85722.1 hypothetical protein CW354_22620 [Marinicaulis flavus]